MIGVIADDLTGAAELGAVGVRHGLRAEILLNGPAEPGADLVCVDTESRSCTAAEAARRAASAARRLRVAGARWIYKKVDSVLRGNVLAEVDAVRRALELKRALLAPANPGLGRTIRGGRYFIHGRPLDRTEFARDPEHPRRSSNVLELLGLGAPRGGTRPAARVRSCSLEDPFLVSGVAVAEVGSSADLKKWAGRIGEDVLPSGGAEFFAASLEAGGLRIRKSLRTATKSKIRNKFQGKGRAKRGRELFVCGSTSQSSREFVAAARRKGTPVFSLPKEMADGAALKPGAAAAIGREAVAAFRAHHRVILRVGLRRVREPKAAKRLAVELVRIAESVIRRARPARVCVEGGATAAELVQRLGWRRLGVLEELAPGVAALGLPGNKQLIIKPGTYVWPSKWTD